MAAGGGETVLSSVAGFVADGFDTLVFWPADPAPEQVELLAAEVVPRLVSAS
jgi:hypothetical protein